MIFPVKVMKSYKGFGSNGKFSVIGLINLCQQLPLCTAERMLANAMPGISILGKDITKEKNSLCAI